MQTVEIDRKLFNYRGQFYPRDHIMAMLPSKDAACAAGKDIVQLGLSPDDVTEVSPDTVIHDLARTARETLEPMPAVGTEGTTARHFVDLARAGHWGLLVHARKTDRDERIVEVLKQHGAQFAERYHLLVIEDLVGQND